MKDENLMAHWMEIVIIVDFAWKTSLGKRFQTMGIYDSKRRAKERAIVAMKLDIQLEEDQEFAMKF